MVVAFGVAKIMQGTKPVRLAAEAFLLFVQKEPKYAWGCAQRPPNAQAAAGYERCEASSVQRRRYALKVPAAHYMWGNCKSAAESYHRKACASLSNEGNELKNFPHSRSVNVEDCGEYIAGFGFQCYRLTSFLSVRPSR